MKKVSCQQRVSSLVGRHLLSAGLFLIGLVACLAIGVSSVQAQSYSVSNLGVVKGMTASEPAAINNQGHVAGTSTAGEHGCAFLYSNNTMKDVGGLDSRGLGISPFGVVVGDAFFPSISTAEAGSHAAILLGETARQDLGVLKGQLFSRANGINTAGQVVGFSGPKRDSDNSRAFIWTAKTGMIDIGTLGGAYAQANAINDAGFVTGTSDLNDLSPIAATHAFIYKPVSPAIGGMRDLGTLGGHSSYGMFINNVNHVVGYSAINRSDDRVHAFFHDGKTMINLGSLGSGLASDYSVALGINNSDQVVGYSLFPASAIQQTAFVWTRNAKGIRQMMNLNKLIGPAAKTYWLFSATAINDAGQIVATAYDYDNNSTHAVLLTPIAPALEQ